jgi:hypothetical protein
MARIVAFNKEEYTVRALVRVACLIAAAMLLGLPGATFAQSAVSPAAVIAGQMTTPDSTIVSVSDFTPATDPDLLLGAPGQYVAKARFLDSAGVQGDVEVFANARDARARLAGLAGGQEIDVTQGLVVLRLSNLYGDSQPYKDALMRAITPS